MVRALGVLRDSKRGERGLNDLLDDGTWSRETRSRAVTLSQSWMDAVADKPGCAVEVKAEKAGGKPVGGHRGCCSCCSDHDAAEADG